MDKIACMLPLDRSDLFTKTADDMHFPAAIIEKDFWVCWVLKHLFGHPMLGGDLIFKGGTSLSKVYGAIERFSEDIDVSISRKVLGFDGERDPACSDLSNKKRQRLLDEMSDTCSKFIAATMNQELAKQFGRVLNQETWTLTIDDNDPDRQTLLFEYPLVETHIHYIVPSVRIEFGCRSDAWPTEKCVVRPYCGELFPEAFDDIECPVTVLNITRTFWEKAIILHQEHHRPAEKALPMRHSRHYYDMAMLAESRFKALALENVDLLEHVVKHKKCFFRCGWANYDAAVPGTLRLLPADERMESLQEDYAAMNMMFFGEAPEFEEILELLGGLEAEINGLQLSGNSR